MLSELTLGYIDKTKYVGEMNWYPVTKQTMFPMKMDDILFNGKSYGLCKPTPERPMGCLLTIDSGTSYMLVPPSLKKQMTDQGLGVRKECDPLTQLGDITFVLNGKHFAVPPTDY